MNMARLQAMLGDSEEAARPGGFGIATLREIGAYPLFRHRLQQLPQWLAQRIGQTFHVVDTDIARTALHLADVCAVQSRPFRQLFLRPGQLVARLAHGDAKSDPDFSNHSAPRQHLGNAAQAAVLMTLHLQNPRNMS